MRFKNENLSGWGNNNIIDSQVFSPKSRQDLIPLIRKHTFIARGLGRSYGDQALNSDDYVVDCTRLNHFLDFNEQTGVLHCEAGVSLADIIEVFAPRGWFPKVNPGTKYVTLGGAIANDIHGKAHHIDGSFANSVIEFTIMLADGSIVTASRSSHSDLFWANFGGLGLLGIILSAKVQLKQIETTYFTHKAFSIRSFDEMVEAFQVNDPLYNYSVAWIDPLAVGKNLGRGILTVGNSAKFSELPTSVQTHPLKVHSEKHLSVPFYLPNNTLNPLSLQVLNRVIRRIQGRQTKFSHYEQFFFPLDMIHHWNRSYGKRGFIQYQFVIPVQATNQLKGILKKISTSGCLPFLNVLKKLGPGHRYLSFPMEGFTLAVDFPMTSKLLELTKTLDKMVLEVGGRIYLGKDSMLSPEMFRHMYPSHQEWMEVKRKFDPENTFSSEIAKRLELNPIKDLVF